MPDFDRFWTWKAWFEMGVVEIGWVEVPRVEDGVGLTILGDLVMDRTRFRKGVLLGEYMHSVW